MKTLKFTSLIILLSALFFSCQKELSFETVITPPGTWQFNDSTKLYTGNIDTAFIETSGTTKTMTLMGVSTDGLQTFFLHLTAIDSFTIGSYKASLYQSDFQYYSQSKNIYQADQSVGEFVVNITALGNNNVTGTFSGASKDSTGNIKNLTLGKFTSRINLAGSGTGSGGTGTATGTLGVSAGACTSTSLAGTYTQGVTLTSANTATVQVTVATLGNYTISTNTVNGVTFSKTGTFTTTGAQSVILNGSGTPANAGAQIFAVTFGASTCNFSVTFGAGTPPVVDYFPTSVGLNWTYGLQGGTTSDSLFDKVINYNPTILSKQYSTITEESFPVQNFPDDSLYFRKPGGDYYQLFNFLFDSPPPGEFIFLKDNVAQGTTWTSPDFTGTSGGSSYTIFLNMTLLAKGVAATSGNITSQDVIKVKYEYYFRSSPATPFATEEKWFAKGIGMIYDTITYITQSGPATDTYNIGQYH